MTTIEQSLVDALEGAEAALEAMMETWLAYHDAHSLTEPVTRASGNAFDKALEARDAARAALHAYRTQDSTGSPAEGMSVGSIMALAEQARKAVVSQPAGFLVDPGAGSAMDRFQTHEPPVCQLADTAERGGRYETLYTGTSVEQIIIHVVRAIEARSSTDANRPTPTPTASPQGEVRP